MSDKDYVEWQLAEVTSPQLAHPVPVVAARDIPYIPNANRLQNLSIYLPKRRKRQTSSALGPGPSRALNPRHSSLDASYTSTAAPGATLNSRPRRSNPPSLTPSPTPP